LILPDHLAGGARQAEKHTLGVDPLNAVPIRRRLRRAVTSVNEILGALRL
jgi:hypothetical protein